MLLVDGILHNPLCLKSSEMIVQTETAPYELILAIIWLLLVTSFGTTVVLLQY